ncbi:MAG TPA: hypothetical protein VII48_12320 [Rhizomicrobium sp.]
MRIHERTCRSSPASRISFAGNSKDVAKGTLSAASIGHAPSAFPARKGMKQDHGWPIFGCLYQGLAAQQGNVACAKSRMSKAAFHGLGKLLAFRDDVVI